MENTQSLFVDGKRFFEKKEYDKAEKCFVALIRAKKNFADVFNMLGIIYHVNGDFNQAIESFEKALKINPNYTEALMNLAVLYNDLGKYKKAAVLYKRVHSAKPKKKEKIDPFLKNKLANKHAELGDIYEGIGLHPEAISEYERALELGPKFLDIRSKLAVSLREDGKYSKAIQVLSQVLKMNPRYIGARIQIGVTFYASGDKKKAVSAWKEALKLSPNNESAKMYLRLAESMPV